MRPVMAKAIGYMKPDIDPNTRLYVPFNEGVGPVAKDYSQYGNHAQLTDVEWSPDGFNGAGEFNGSSSYGDCGNDASLNITDAKSIEAYVYRIGSGINWQYIAGNSRGNYNGGYALKMETSDRMSFFLANGVDKTPMFTTTAVLPANEWVYVVGLWDGGATVVSGSIRIYFNGVNQAGSELHMGETSVGNSNEVYIGSFNGVSTFFDGTIDNVIVSSTARSAAQIAADCYEVVCS